MHGRHLRHHSRHGRYGHPHHPGHSILFGLTVIGAGALILLDNLHVFALPLLSTFWPLALVLWGLGRLVWPRHRGSWIFGALLIAGGALMTAQNLGYTEFEWRHWWPVLVIVAGISIVLRGIFPHRHAPAVEGFSASTIEHGDHVNINANFSAVNQQNDSRAFKGGQIDVNFGGVELDLRQAAMDGPEAVLSISARFSGIELRVPRDWLVVVNIAATLGGVHDQTLPPMNPTQRLVLRGEAMFGGVEIRN